MVNITNGFIMDVLFHLLKHKKKIDKDTLEELHKELYMITIVTTGEVLNVYGLSLSIKEILAILYFLQNKITNERINELYKRKQEYNINQENEYYIDKSAKEILAEINYIADKMALIIETNKLKYLDGDRS